MLDQTSNRMDTRTHSSCLCRCKAVVAYRTQSHDAHTPKVSSKCMFGESGRTCQTHARGLICIPVRPGIESAAQQDDLASLLLQVHVDELHCLQQLGIQECCSKVVKVILLCVAW